MSDWLYTQKRLKLRADCLSNLLHKYGWELDENKLPKYPMETMHNCAHDWVSQGNNTPIGIASYFLDNYTG